MPPSETPQVDPNLQDGINPETQNSPAEGDSEPSALEELQNELAGLRDQLSRERERGETLSQTNRLLERSIPQSSKDEGDIPAELKEVNQLLSPLFTGA